MFKVKRVRTFAGLFLLSFVFAIALTMTMVSTSMACLPGECTQYFEECPYGCNGSRCLTYWTNGADGPVCCGEITDVSCIIGPVEP